LHWKVKLVGKGKEVLRKIAELLPMGFPHNCGSIFFYIGDLKPPDEKKLCFKN